MKNAKKWALFGLAPILLISVVGFAYWLGKRQSTDSTTKLGTPPATATNTKGTSGPPPTTVDAATVSLAPFAKTISAVGSLRSDETVIIRPEVSGRIAEIGFREGQRVAKGSVILKLDQAIQRAEMQQAEANLSLSKSRIERSRDLHTKGFISSQALDDAESAYKVAKATADLASARLTKLEIKAPFAGIVGLRSVSLGDYVREGQDIVNLEEIDQLKVDFRVPEIYLRQISVGQNLQVNIDANPGETFTGRVLAINPLLDASGRAVVIRAVVNNNNAKLRPGMFARVKLITSERQESLTIPEQALIPVGDDFFVFKITEGRVARTKIEIGQRITGSVEVLKGLVKDDAVVTAGQPKIRDGAAVRLATLDGKPAVAAQPSATSAPLPSAATVATPPAKKS
jgi:membrane fusion protein, multidrug efflux system